ncbi:MAG: hypothetical protein DBY17_05180 [Oscillospiraceae bacterium]|nr:MAG: hypothetical protein DBY17_05180 [Oscillospiraceae bacterium]
MRACGTCACTEGIGRLHLAPLWPARRPGPGARRAPVRAVALCGVPCAKSGLWKSTGRFLRMVNYTVKSNT